MPAMDGYEATRVIRQLEKEQTGRPTATSADSIPDDGADSGKCAFIIALTGVATARAEEGAYEAGMDMFLTKPLHFAKLAQLLNNWENGTITSRAKM
jgi:CheY-like chemotaxis protein